MATAFKPPATQRLYDACVLGGGPGGVAAGALLSRRGLRVLLVDLGTEAARADGGWLLPPGPTLAPAARAMPAAESLLAELGLANDVARAFEPLAPDLQLLWPRHRLELSRDPARLAAELGREWPADAARLAAALRALAGAAEAAGLLLSAAPPLPPSGLLERLALRRALGAAARAAGTARGAIVAAQPLAGLADHPLAAALLALPRFLGHMEGPPAPLSTARLGGVALRGLHRLAPGAPSLGESLRRKLTETRGEVLGTAAEPARLQELAAEGGRLGAVRVAGSPDAFVARAFLLAVPLAALLPHLPAGAREGPAARALARLRPGRRLASRHLVLGPAGIPPGLGPAALVMAGDGSPDQAVLLEVSAARREPRKGHPEPPAAERLVSAFTLAPAEGDAAPALARIDAALAEILPFHARHLVHAAAPPPVPHLTAVEAPALGVAGLPVRSPWKNALLASRDVLPGLGLEGELYAGLQAAAHALAVLGVKGRPR